MSAVILLACCVFVIVIVLATMLRMLGGDADALAIASAGRHPAAWRCCSSCG